MLGAMTSLTGGGGMSASSSATNGDFGSDSNYTVGNMTFGTNGANSGNTTVLIVAAVAVIGFVLWKRK